MSSDLLNANPTVLSQASLPSRGRGKQEEWDPFKDLVNTHSALIFDSEEERAASEDSDVEFEEREKIDAQEIYGNLLLIQSQVLPPQRLMRHK